MQLLTKIEQNTQLTFTVNTVTCVMGTTQGSGMHMADLTPDQIEAALMVRKNKAQL